MADYSNIRHTCWCLRRRSLLGICPRTPESDDSFRRAQKTHESVCVGYIHKQLRSRPAVRVKWHVQIYLRESLSQETSGCKVQRRRSCGVAHNRVHDVYGCNEDFSVRCLFNANQAEVLDVPGLDACELSRTLQRKNATHKINDTPTNQQAHHSNAITSSSIRSCCSMSCFSFAVSARILFRSI